MKLILYVLGILGSLFITAILTIGFLSLVNKSFDKSEVVECLKWQNYAKNMPAFYLTDWQKEQCDRHDITINAPVVYDQR